jgi:YfaZ precursor
MAGFLEILMVRKLLLLPAIGTVLVAGGALAQDRDAAAEVALSNDTLQVRYIMSGDRFGADGGQASAGFFLSEERDIVLSGGVLFPANLELGPVSVLFGPRAYAALLDEENSDVMALTVGTQLRFDLDRRRGFAIVGEAFYSPDILTFGSADNLTDLSARAELRLTPQLTGFAGMRWFEFDLTEGDGERTLQEELFAGVGWRF